MGGISPSNTMYMQNTSEKHAEYNKLYATYSMESGELSDTEPLRNSCITTNTIHVTNLGSPL